LGMDHLRIHDFIISEFLGLDGSEPGGCEAGNSIAFIDCDGIVYPCCSLLIPLGDLNEDDFDGIWKNPARDRIRKDLLELPSVCRSCSLLAACQGRLSRDRVPSVRTLWSPGSALLNRSRY
jgi:radical SAM protein with 4Fe4S-binding SPASM domain